MNKIITMVIRKNGGYQLRKTSDGIMLDVCKDGKCFSIYKSDIEFLVWKLKKECKILNTEIGKFLSSKKTIQGVIRWKMRLEY